MKCSVIRVRPQNFKDALQKTEALLKQKGDKEITLNFTGGSFDLDRPFTLDAKDFPGKCRLRMVGGSRIPTVFTALSPLDAKDFHPVEGKPYYMYQFPKKEDGTYPLLRAFYVNRKLATVAETKAYKTAPQFTPEQGMDYDIHLYNWVDKYRHRLYVPLEAVEEAGVENCKGAELHLRVEWEFKPLHIEYADMEDIFTAPDGKKYVALQLNRNEPVFGCDSLHLHERVFFITNTTSVLDKPGKFAYEQACGRLYYYPEKNIEDNLYEIGKADHLFHFKNFDSLTMQGLTFTGVEDGIVLKIGFYGAGQAGAWESVFPELCPHQGAVKIDSCEELDVDGCLFRDLPCEGISMIGVLHNVTVRNSRFIRLGATGIRMGRPNLYDKDNQIHNVKIENNFLYDIANVYENCCAMTLTKIKGGRILHNTVEKCSYTAISVGWKWLVAFWNYGEDVNLENVEIAYNYVKSFMTRMRDGGGIYTLGGNVDVSHSAYMNQLHDNYVIEGEDTCPENGFFGALYHDGASSNWYTYNNVVVHNPALTGPVGPYNGRLYLQFDNFETPACTEGQSAWHILCENNYFVACKNFGEVYRSQGVDPEKASDMLDKTRDLREKDTHIVKKLSDLKKFPDAMRVTANAGCDKALQKKN